MESSKKITSNAKEDQVLYDDIWVLTSLDAPNSIDLCILWYGIGHKLKLVINV